MPSPVMVSERPDGGTSYMFGPLRIHLFDDHLIWSQGVLGVEETAINYADIISVSYSNGGLFTTASFQINTAGRRYSCGFSTSASGLEIVADEINKKREAVKNDSNDAISKLVNELLSRGSDITDTEKPLNQNVDNQYTGQININPNSVDPTLSRIELFLEDAEWNKANAYIEAALDYFPTEYRLYLLKLCVEKHEKQIDDLYKYAKSLREDASYKRAKKFANNCEQWEEFENCLDSFEEKIIAAEQEAREKEENEKKREKKKKEEEKKQKESEYKKKSRAILATREKIAENIIIAAPGYTVGIDSNGGVLTAGAPHVIEKGVSKWKNVVMLAPGGMHIVGLCEDGTVVACGKNNEGQCNVGNWGGIVALAAGDSHTLGLREDGTVVACGKNYDQQCEVDSWKGVISIATGMEDSLGITKNRNILSTGSTSYGQYIDLNKWTRIIDASAGYDHIIGLRSDGSVVAVGNNNYNQCDVTDWKDIIAISAGLYQSVGIRKDGTVVATGVLVVNRKKQPIDVSAWKNVVAISAGGDHIVGLLDNGNVVAVGDNKRGQCNLNKWKLKLPE